jgi:hypothetical protein
MLSKSALSPKHAIKHHMRFATIYFPGTIKDIRLYFRLGLSPDSFLSIEKKNKILLKQSYIILVWLHYLTQQCNSPQDETSGDYGADVYHKIPKFFIHPKRNYKITIQKAPMAHKTFSQEQYMIRYYVMSISFIIPLNRTTKYPIGGINSSLYYALTILAGLPHFSTNLLWVKSYSLTYLTHDSKFFSYYNFNRMLKNNNYIK